MPNRRSACGRRNDAQSTKWRTTSVRRTKPRSSRKPAPTPISEYCSRVWLSSQPIDALPVPWFRVSSGLSERAAKPFRLRLLKKRKFTSAPATRLKSWLPPEGWRESTIAPTSELPRMSRRARTTV